MRKIGARVLLIFFIILANAKTTLAQEYNTAVVQAILFWSPTCPHCHNVIENELPPIKEQYGDQLQLLGIDTSKQIGAQLYDDTVKALEIPDERLGVPTMIIGEVVLVGSVEIPEKLPTLIEEGLASGGIGWPRIPGLEEAVPDLPLTASIQIANAASGTVTESNEELMAEALPSDSTASPEDPVGFAIGWVVMAIMFLALIFTVVRLVRTPSGTLSNPAVAERLCSWLIPALALAGLGIALYLAYVEITQVAAVCGPVGKCNIVQSSPYAFIFGIPVAVLGSIFYLAILGLWLLLRFAGTGWAKLVPTIFLCLTILGVLFSIYLTALELLVIKAVCAWCLGSAVVTTLLLLITVHALTKSTAEIHPQGAASHAS
jgi:uncharacterized membrane protein